MKWLSLWWYKYLFEKPYSITTIWCRMHGHPCGVIWYTDCTALEPDMHCKNCGDYLG